MCGVQNPPPPSDTESSPDPPAAEEKSEPATLKSTVDLIATIAGFATFITALLLYFGYVRTQAFFRYFGVPMGILNYSTTDLLLRSADALFRPVAYATMAIIVAATLTVGAERCEKSTGWKRIFARWVMAVFTCVALAAGICVLLDLKPPGWQPVWSAMALTIAGLLLVMQHRQYNAGDSQAPTSLFAVGLLILLVGAFWCVNNYAADVGRKSAQQQANSAQLPEVVVYSKENLVLTGRAQLPVVPGSDEQWRFLFGGYRVLTYSNDRWFFIRQDDNGALSTDVIVDSDSLQVRLLPKQPQR